MKFLANIYLSLLVFSSADAAVVSVAPGQFATFSLDIDGDGQAEISPLSQHIGVVLFTFKVDGMAPGSYVTFPDVTFAGHENRSFANLSSLSLNSIFSGTFSAPTIINREFDNIEGFATIQPSSPIYASWIYGTSGSGSAPLSLIGMVMDFSAYFASGGVSAVDIYYQNYGSFSAGQSAGPISLATTGVPEPSSSVLILAAITLGSLSHRRSRA